MKTLRWILALLALAFTAPIAWGQSAIKMQKGDTIAISTLIVPGDTVLRITGTRYACKAEGVTHLTTVVQRRNQFGVVLHADSIPVLCGNLSCPAVMAGLHASADTGLSAQSAALVKLSGCRGGDSSTAAPAARKAAAPKRPPE